MKIKALVLNFVRPRGQTLYSILLLLLPPSAGPTSAPVIRSSSPNPAVTGQRDGPSGSCSHRQRQTRSLGPAKPLAAGDAAQPRNPELSVHGIPRGHIFARLTDARLRFLRGAGRAAPAQPPVPLALPHDPPSYLPECVYNYTECRAAGGRRSRAESAAGQRGVGGQHAVYFNFSESFLGDFPPPLLNSDEPLGRLGRMWFRALFSFVIFFFFCNVSPLTLSGRVPHLSTGVPG